MKISDITDEEPVEPPGQEQLPVQPPQARPPQPPQPQVPVRQPVQQLQPDQPKPIQKLMVIVHPGSACGSADFNLGKYEARAARDGLEYEINRWNDGGVFVIDGDLSDELPYHPDLDEAIKDALNDASTRGQIAIRVRGDDGETPNQVDRARQFIKKYKLNPAEWLISLTGAWMEEGDSGCVRSVMDEFQRHGFRTDVMDSALWLYDDDWESDREEE